MLAFRIYTMWPICSLERRTELQCFKPANIKAIKEIKDLSQNFKPAETVASAILLVTEFLSTQQGSLSKRS